MEGSRISPFSHATDVDQDGGVGDEVTEDHWGAPERLRVEHQIHESSKAVLLGMNLTYAMEVTAQPRWAAALHMRLPMRTVSTRTVSTRTVQAARSVKLRNSRANVPRNPLPPQTTSFFFAADAIVVACEDAAFRCSPKAQSH